MVGIDTNILLYAHDRSSPFLEPAKQFIASACEEGIIGIADLSLLEFYSVITDGRKIPEPLSPSDASEIVDDILSADEFQVFSFNHLIMNKTLVYARKHHIARYGINDIYIAQTLAYYGIKSIFTANVKDFKKFDFIEAINPFPPSAMPSEPYVSPMIPYARQSISEKDVAAVCSVLRSDWITAGPKVAEFEKAVAAYCGARYAIAVSNGTAALHVAAMAIGLGNSDEGITSPNTFLASANCVAFCGAAPHFADIDPRTYCIDPDEIRKSITPQTRVIIPVHFAGCPCEMEAIWEIAIENSLFVIEDAVHAIGASWEDRKGVWHKTGSCSHSHLTIFSFHPVKTITTGEGGMILTNDEGLADKCRLLRNHGITRDPANFVNHPSTFGYQPFYYEMHELGYNYRITDIQCALGISQMERLDQFVTRRREIWACYSVALEGIDGFQTPVERVGVRSAWHLYVAQSDERDELLKFLNDNGVGAHAMYIPVHLQPYYQEHFNYYAGDFPRSEAYFKKSIVLPLYPSLTDGQIEYITNQVKRYYQH